MKHFYALTCLMTLAFALPLFSTAQDLAYNTTPVTNYTPLKNAGPMPSGGEMPLVKSKQWEKEEDRINGRISRSSLAKMKSSTDAMISFLQDSCLAESNYTPVWHGEYYSEKVGFGPLMKFGVQCTFSNAHLSIMANDISPLLDHIIVNNKEYLTMAQPSGIKNNCPYFELPASGDDAARSAIWLVSAGDQQPYTVVTRKEYLQEAQAELNGLRSSLIAEIKDRTPIRSLAIQEAEKKAAIDELNNTYSGMDLQVRMRMFLKDYRTDEAYLKESADKATAGLDSTLHLMESLLKNLSARDLARPAIVSVTAAEFEGFEDGLADRKMLIRMNSSYFSTESGVEKAQFFLVQWSFNRNDPEAAGMDSIFREKFDVPALQGMLGK